MAHETSICIVSRNEILREGLRRILTDQAFFVAATATDSAALMAALAGRDTPDLIIVEAAMDADGIETCRMLREQLAQSRIVLLGSNYSIEATSRAMAVGVDGYLVKEMSCEPLVSALRLVVLGEKVMPSKTVNALGEKCRGSAECAPPAATTGVRLSDREIKILGCLIRGDANKLISRQLEITESTVKVHIKAILRKLSVLNRTQAALWAVSHGMPGQFTAASETLPASSASLLWNGEGVVGQRRQLRP